MEIITTNNLSIFLSPAHAINCEGGGVIISQFTGSITDFFALVFLILLVISLSTKNCTKYGHKHKSTIQVISLVELVKSLWNHKFAVLPSLGYLFKKYDGALKFTIGNFKVVLVAKPSIIQKLYLSPNPGHLHKPVELDKIVTKSLKGNLGTFRADVWKAHRSVLARAFTFNSLQEQIKIFDHYSKKLVIALDESLELQQESEIYQKFSNQTCEHTIVSHILYIILHIGSGMSIVENHVETARFVNLFEKFKQLVVYRVERPWLVLDSLWFFHPKSWKLDRTMIKLKSMFPKVVKAAQMEFISDHNYDEDMTGKSLIDLMVKARFTDDDIFKEFFFFVVVNNESISGTTKFLLFYLALHPELQEKCRQEVCQLFEKLHERGYSEISIDLLNELQYLEKCVMETIRLHPTLTFLARMLESPLNLDEHTTIDPGTRVFTSAYHLHRDPNYYPQPEKFDPERFSLESVKKRGKCEYMGFSEGPRNCIGKKSAMLEIKVLISYILYNFEVYTPITQEIFETDVEPIIKLRRRS